jgi:peptide deformylase
VILSAKKLPNKCQQLNPLDILVLCNIYDELYDELQKLNSKTDSIGIAYGLAAIQIGLPYAAFMVNNAAINGKPGIDYQMIINPSYYNVGTEQSYLAESCLSLGKSVFIVPRYKHIRAMGKMFHYPYVVDYPRDLTGINAIVFQHETDHCNLITINKIAKLEVQP